MISIKFLVITTLYKTENGQQDLDTEMTIIVISSLPSKRRLSLLWGTDK